MFFYKTVEGIWLKTFVYDIMDYNIWKVMDKNLSEIILITKPINTVTFESNFYNIATV